MSDQERTQPVETGNKDYAELIEESDNWRDLLATFDSRDEVIAFQNALAPEENRDLLIVYLKLRTGENEDNQRDANDDTSYDWGAAIQTASDRLEQSGLDKKNNENFWAQIAKKVREDRSEELGSPFQEWKLKQRKSDGGVYDLSQLDRKPNHNDSLRDMFSELSGD